MIESKPVEIAVCVIRNGWCKYDVDVIKAIRGCCDVRREIHESVPGSRTFTVAMGVVDGEST